MHNIEEGKADMKETGRLFSILCCSWMLSATSGRSESVDFGTVNPAPNPDAAARNPQ